MTDPLIIWIEKPLAVAIHERQLAEHGGVTGVRDEKLLESALARPQQLFAHGDPPPDIADLAASLACGVARNHPFVDGNKRTALTCLEYFLYLNGFRLDASPAQRETYTLKVASAHPDLTDVAHWVAAHLVKAY